MNYLLLKKFLPFAKYYCTNHILICEFLKFAVSFEIVNEFNSIVDSFLFPLSRKILLFDKSYLHGQLKRKNQIV